MVILGGEELRDRKSRRWRKVYGSRKFIDKLILGVIYYGQIASVAVINVVSIGSCSGGASGGCGCRGCAVMVSFVVLEVI